MKTKRNPFNMEKNKSIYNSTHYIPAVMLCHQYDPTAIEREENFTKKALQKTYDIMLELYPDRTTSFKSFSTYMNYIPNIKANKGRWSKYFNDREKIIKILDSI